MKRHPHLVNKAIAYYLAASILSSIVVQLNTLVDGVVVGQYVSTDAFSALNKDGNLIVSITHDGKHADVITDGEYRPEVEHRHMFGQDMIDLTWSDDKCTYI